MSSDDSGTHSSRRAILKSAAAASLLGSAAYTGPRRARGQTPRQASSIPQSIVHWCFASHGERWSVERTCQVAKELGYASVELVSPEDFATVKRFGLTCAIVGARINPGPGFMRGFNNPRFHPMVIQATREAIDSAAAHGFPNVIAFTGYSAHDPDQPAGPHFSLEEGAANCVRGLKEVMGQAEKQGVNICLEMLNTRDDSDPMKGHPGYQGNHVDYCIDIIKAVGSPRMKLLFDIYHVQIMDGDIMRRLEQHREYLGHVHTAGNPGRGELSEHQEINYRAVMNTLKKIGYQGFVGQEFIPTSDPYAGLKQAFAVCSV